MNRREFVSALAAVPFAAKSVLAAQAPSIPIIDTHIHLWDRTRPGTAHGCPDDDQHLCYPQNDALGLTSLPPRYRAVSKPFGVVGVIVVEASPRLEDNQWVLDQAATDPIFVGTVGKLDPADPAFGKNLERFRKNELFRGIRIGSNPRFLVPRWTEFAEGLEKPEFVSNLKLMADAGLSLDNSAGQRTDASIVLVRLTDKVPSLRLIIDHLPGVRLPEERAVRDAYVAGLKELGKRPQVYIKLSAVVRRVDNKVSTDLDLYSEWLDQLWDIFGENRVIFGSDFPNSEGLELNSFPNVMNVAREYVAGKGSAATEKVFWRNSVAAYRWIRRDSSQPQA